LSAQEQPALPALHLVREDTSHQGLMAALADEARVKKLQAKVCFLARARYGILPQDAEDIFHDAVATYLVIRNRYGSKDNHFGLLVGIFHKKALEFLDVRDRQGRIAKRFVNRLRAARPDVARGEDPYGTADERIIRSEEAGLIQEVVAELPEEWREVLLAIAEKRETRLSVIERMQMNRNTFDTRVRRWRLELKKKLLDSGIEVVALQSNVS
jgi:DNA-directed RNA polymerase specialized sigma24 family protein